MMDRERSGCEEGVGAHILRVRDYLMDCGIVNVVDLARRFEVCRADARAALDYWVRHGVLEVLRPCLSRQEQNDDWDYYRWKLSSDDDFIWEKEIFAGRSMNKDKRRKVIEV